MSTPLPIPAEALDLLADWLPDNDEPRRPFMWLSTAGETGEPDTRAMLMTSYSETGFSFTTENLTRKVVDLMANPRVALGFLLDDPVRQLTVQGLAERDTADATTEAYRRASRFRQLLVWLNSNDFARLPDDERQKQWEEFAAEHPEGELEPPERWIGFHVFPERLAFWTHSAYGTRRVEFSQAGGEWIRSVLPG